MSIDITQELHQNFIDYAYECNSQRAFPDARDGLILAPLFSNK